MTEETYEAFLLLAINAVVPLLVGCSVCLLMDFCAGPHRSPHWHKVAISVGFGLMVAFLCHLFREPVALALWQTSLIGASAGALGAWAGRGARRWYDDRLEAQLIAQAGLRADEEAPAPGLPPTAGVRRGPLSPISNRHRANSPLGDYLGPGKGG